MADIVCIGIKETGAQTTVIDGRTINYDNINLYCTTNVCNGVRGLAPVVLKIKRFDMARILGIYASKLDALINKHIIPRFTLTGSKTPVLDFIEVVDGDYTVDQSTGEIINTTDRGKK